MTFENSKRLYNHYVNSKLFDNANELLEKYPELGKKEEKSKEEKPKKTKKTVKK